MNKEPIRHHYIPQFILRNFCFDDSGMVHYYDKKTKEVTDQHIRDVFMVRNLYRDEINHFELPTQIENDLARYEGEISKIIKDKFLCENKIILSLEENEKLKLFFAIMGFRSKNASKIFGENATKESTIFYSQFQQDGNLSDFWKRNLGYMVNCRSFNEVLNHEHIDEPIKIFMRRDAFGYFGQYFAVVEPREDEEFVLGDIYPLVLTGTLPNGLEIGIYNINIISPKRAILKIEIGATGTPRHISCLRECILYPPSQDAEKITIHVKKLYNEELKYINELAFDIANEGFVFKSFDQ